MTVLELVWCVLSWPQWRRDTQGMNQGQDVTGVREGLATQKKMTLWEDRMPAKGKIKKRKNWFTAVFAPMQILEAYFFDVKPSPPVHPLVVTNGMTEWYSEPSSITMPSLRLASVQRERERGGREMAKSLWDSGTALRQVNPQITQPNTSAALSLCTFALSFLSRPRVIKCEGVCRLGSYTAGNSPPSSYSSSCPSRTLLSPSVTSRCERLRPLGLCQDQYVWMLGKPLGHATEWH